MMIRFAAWALAWLIALICVIWAIGAIYFDFPFASLRVPVAIVFGTICVAAAVFVRGQSIKARGCPRCVLRRRRMVVDLETVNDANWQPDLAETGSAEIDGDLVTIHNVRNCQYRTETDFTPHWETRTVHLSHDYRNGYRNYLLGFTLDGASHC